MSFYNMDRGNFGGHPTWAAYRAAFDTCQCVVCGKFGFGPGEQEFEFVVFPYHYAHESCATLARIFPDLRSPAPGYRSSFDENDLRMEGVLLISDPRHDNDASS